MASEKSIEAMLARRRSHAAMHQGPSYRVKCPRCGALPEQPCRRPDGERRPLHMERLDVQDPQEVLF
jgi:hypothetical protein